MNRQQRRQQEKERRKRNKGVLVSHSSYGPYEWKAKSGNSEPVKDQEPYMPGINAPPVLAYFNQMVEMNMWHDRSELDKVIETIKKLSDESDDNPWSWAYNHECKYVDIRFDMRDGAFTLMNQNRERICLEQLEWQYKSAVKKDDDERSVPTSV